MDSSRAVQNNLIAKNSILRPDPGAAAAALIWREFGFFINFSVELTLIHATCAKN